ncbi:MAG TPA: cadmium resistance transporter [Longimicrobiales bacterium]|nr:cadmium resistance transporter [Longimicrobiales bacterium]
MLERLTVAALAAASFVATSFDNFTLLLGFFSNPRYSRRRVVLGYLASTACMVLLAYGVSTAVEQAPTRTLGYLGLVPLAFGLHGLYRLRRPGVGTGDADRVAERGFVAVFLVMLANSGDTFAVFVSVFADTVEGLEGWILIAALAMAALYGLVARWLVSRERVADAVARVARLALPFLLVLIGLYILADTGTDVVP